MPKRSERDRFNGHSSGLTRRAEESQRSGPFRRLVRRHEGKRPKPPLNEPGTINPGGYYKVDETIKKGFEFPGGVLPINTREIKPSFTTRLKVELRLLTERLFGR